MTEDLILESASGLNFPLAPEKSDAPGLTKKRATKKAASKKVAKKAAKAVAEEVDAPAPAAKKVSRKKAAVKLEELSAPPVDVEVVETPVAKKTAAKKVARKKAVVAEEAPAPLPVAPPVIQVEAPAPQVAPVAEVAPVSERPVSEVRAAESRHDSRFARPQHGMHQHRYPKPQRQHQQHQQHPSSEQAFAGQGEAVSGEQGHHPNQGKEWPRDSRGKRISKWKLQREKYREMRQTQRTEREKAIVERPLGPEEPSEGILEITPKGYGFLRQKSRQYAQFAQDPWVSPEMIRQIGLREGMFIKGIERMGHRGPQVTEIKEVNGLEPDKIRDLPLFDELKAVNPNKRIQLETRSDRMTTRVMDLITPVGRGQRGLIVAPPRAGKTTLLMHIAEAITQNHPQMHLMILLVDERPEEVTEFRRAFPNAEVHASSNDSDVKSHLRTASFAIERAKRLVESGHHVFMLLDSITRMGRAFNNAHKGGATMSGGVGVGALELPRRLFAAARNTRDAGSLTILATTLIETNSRMDELIFQEFKGTGNLELVLDRKIAEQYIYPAVNIFRSGTRREELLLPAFQMEKIHMLRRGLAGHKPMEAIQRVLSLMERYPSNTQMLIELPGKSS